MQFFYENQNSNSFLCYKIDAGCEVDSFYYGMLSNNKMANIISPIYSIENDEKYFRYNVTAKITLKDYFTGMVQRKRVLNILYSMVCGIIESDEYMIDQNVFALDMNYIFVDVNTQEAYLIALPVKDIKCDVTIYDFIKGILFSLNYDQSENTNYVAEILSFLNSNHSLSLIELKKLLFELIDESKTNQNISSAKYSDNVIAASKPETKMKHEEIKHQAVEKKNEYKIIDDSKSLKGLNYISDSEQKSFQGNKAESVKAIEIPEKKMTLLHLLSNFSKENLEIYKAQNSNMKKATNTSKSKAIPGKSMGFAIPGAESNNAQSKPFEVPDHSNRKSELKNKSQDSKDSQAKIESNQNHSKPINTYGKKPTGGRDNFGETMYFDENILNSTMFIDENLMDKQDENKHFAPKLIRSSNGEVAEITYSPFKLGKNPEFADYCISGNPAISGAHAFIYSDNGQCYIKDANSKNHVYINEKMIHNGELVHIEHGDIICLANENFEFKLY